MLAEFEEIEQGHVSREGRRPAQACRYLLRDQFVYFGDRGVATLYKHPDRPSLAVPRHVLLVSRYALLKERTMQRIEHLKRRGPKDFSAAAPSPRGEPGGSMEPKLSGHRTQSGRLHDLAAHDLHRMQGPIELVLPEGQEFPEFRQMWKQIELLPDECLNDVRVIGR